jgi:hypothetical protein
MKTTLLTLLFSIFITVAFAQTTKIGLEGGIGIANQSNEKGVWGYMGPLATFHAGIIVDMDFQDFAFQPGLLYSGKGHSQKNYLNPGYGQFTTQVERTHLNYLEIPLNLVGKIHTSKNVSINLGGGPYFGIGVSANSTYNGQTTQLGFGKTGLYRSLDYGVNAIAEVEFNKKFLIKTNYSNSLADISHWSDGVHNYVFGLSVAYLFN